MYSASNIAKNAFINKVSMLLLALMPILSWYKIPFPVSLGNALLLFLSSYVILQNLGRINVLPRMFWVVSIYICFIWMSQHNFEFWTLLPPGGWVFFIFVLALVWGIKTFNISLLKKYMRWVILISGILFWVQFLLVVVIGNPLICFVPNITGAFTYEDFTYADIVARHLDGGLPSSIFLEKSYLAYYFLTYLTIVWFESNTEDRLFNKEIVFVIATLIASRSGTALVGFSILFSIKIFSIYWTADIRRRAFLIIMFIPLILGVAYLYIDSEFGQTMLSRSEELSSEGSSGYTRIIAGYIMFDQLETQEKLLGISNASERFGHEKANGNFVFYVNGVQSILLSLGYIGAILYFLFYASVFRKVKLKSKICIIVLLVMSLLESNYLNPYMMLLTIIPCAEAYYKNSYEKNNASLRNPSRGNQNGSARKGVSEISRIV